METKTTAATEKARRNAKATKGSELAAIQELLDSKRYSYVGLTKPADDKVPAGAKLRKVVRHNNKPLAKPIYTVTKVEGAAGSASTSAKAKAKSGKRTSKRASKGTSTQAEQGYIGAIDSPRVQEILAKINKHTKERPLTMRSFGDSQYPKRIARELAKRGLVKSEKRDELGTVFFAK